MNPGHHFVCKHATYLHSVEAGLDAVQRTLAELVHAGLDVLDGHLARHRERLPPVSDSEKNVTHGGFATKIG